MILFWALGCALIVRALSQKQAPNYPLIGVCILLGALYKWPIYLLWSFVIGLTPIFPNLKSKKIIVGILISLLGLFPSLFWNSTHDWVTIRHVTQSIEGSDLASHGQENTYHGNPLEFIGAQIALVSPLVFLFLFAAITHFFGKRKRGKNLRHYFSSVSHGSLFSLSSSDCPYSKRSKEIGATSSTQQLLPSTLGTCAKPTLGIGYGSKLTWSFLLSSSALVLPFHIYRAMAF
jgi:hypothetical protein